MALKPRRGAWQYDAEAVHAGRRRALAWNGQDQPGDWTPSGPHDTVDDHPTADLTEVVRLYGTRVGVDRSRPRRAMGWTSA